MFESETEARAAQRADRQEQLVQKFLETDSPLRVAEQAIAAYVEYVEIDGELQRANTTYDVALYQSDKVGQEAAAARIALLKEQADERLSVAGQLAAVSMAAKIVAEARQGQGE